MKDITSPRAPNQKKKTFGAGGGGGGWGGGVPCHCRCGSPRTSRDGPHRAVTVGVTARKPYGIIFGALQCHHTRSVGSVGGGCGGSVRCGMVRARALQGHTGRCTNLAVAGPLPHGGAGRARARQASPAHGAAVRRPFLSTSPRVGRGTHLADFLEVARAFQVVLDFLQHVVPFSLEKARGPLRALPRLGRHSHIGTSPSSAHPHSPRHPTHGSRATPRR